MEQPQLDNGIDKVRNLGQNSLGMLKRGASSSSRSKNTKIDKVIDFLAVPCNDVNIKSVTTVLKQNCTEDLAKLK